MRTTKLHCNQATNWRSCSTSLMFSRLIVNRWRCFPISLNSLLLPVFVSFHHLFDFLFHWLAPSYQVTERVAGELWGVGITTGYSVCLESYLPRHYSSAHAQWVSCWTCVGVDRFTVLLLHHVLGILLRKLEVGLIGISCLWLTRWERYESKLLY